MRIGIITGEYPPMQGGVGAFSRELALALSAQGHELHIFTHKRASGASEPGINVSGLAGDWHDWWNLIAIRRWINANRLDVVNLQYEAAAYQMAPPIHFLPMLIRDIPVVTTFHDLLVPYLFPKAGPLRWRALLMLARTSQGVIVTNRQDEQGLTVEKGIRRLCAIPIGSNVRAEMPPGYEREMWRARLQTSPPQSPSPNDGGGDVQGHIDTADEVFIGYFGFLNASKGIEVLIEGLELAVKQGIKARLVMIGGRTGDSDPANVAYAEEIEALIAQKNLQVYSTGFADDAQVSAHLYACDLVALPYRDGVSFRRGSFMAALAHGCAIITTHPAVELPELRDGENVRLIPPDSPTALAAAIRELGSDHALRERLQAGAKQLAARFTWDRIAAQTADFYREIIGANSVE
jgi:glycosyltransferase involved in cell wall biosynthesis